MTSLTTYLSQHSAFTSYKKTVQSCFRTVATLAATLGCASAVAAGSAQWSSTNFQYLVSSKYQAIDFATLESQDESASIITFEHVNGWKYGDNFFFFDVTNPDRTGETFKTSYYGEFSPRLSLGKITGSDLSFGIVKDVLLSTTVELGNGFRNYLYGFAVDLSIPHVPVAQINYYIRNDIGPNKDTGQQLTLDWLAPFSLGSTAWTFEGFFDYSFGMDYAEDNIVAGPRILMDLGKTWGAPDALQLGVEVQIWRNKFGIDGIDETAPQAMLKWIW